jgi:hypothetical protein
MRSDGGKATAERLDQIYNVPIKVPSATHQMDLPRFRGEVRAWD